MYLADQLYTTNNKDFQDRIDKRELPTCPPRNEGAAHNNIHDTELWYSWEHNGRRVLYHGAPFAVVRWINMWFPPRFGFFGDWFGGALRPLYGNGIRDISIGGDTPSRYWPGYAHALYFKMTKQEPPAVDSVTTALRKAMALDATEWLNTPPIEPANRS